MYNKLKSNLTTNRKLNGTNFYYNYTHVYNKKTKQTTTIYIYTIYIYILKTKQITL